MKVQRVITLILIALGLFAVSCKRENAEDLDRESIESIVSESDYFKVEGDHLEGQILPDTFDFSVKFPIKVVGWWRRPLSISRNIFVEFHGDTANVDVATHVYGLFTVVYYDLSGDSTFTLSRKFHDVIKRKAVFVREGNVEDVNRGWFLKAVSLGYSLTRDIPDSLLNFAFDSVKVTYSGDSTAIWKWTRESVENLTLYPLDSLPKVGSRGRVRVDVYASSPNLLAYWYRGLRWGTPVRVRLNRDPDNPRHFYGEVDVPSDSFKVARFGLHLIPKSAFDTSGVYRHKGVIIPLRR